MTLLVGLLLITISFAAMGYPLLKGYGRRGQHRLLPEDPEREELLSRRDSTYAAIKELEFERELGNLSEADYLELRQRYRLRAAALLRDLETLPDGPEVRGAVPAGAKAPANRSTATRKREFLCPACGRPQRRGDQYCAECGQSLSSRCPRCGAPSEANHRFCGRCGATLRENDHG